MLHDRLRHYRLILGSGSPRRKELLSSLGLNFDIRVCPLDEVVPANIPIIEHPIFLAKQKADFLAPDLCSNDLLITADTVVIKNQQILGKPETLHDARDMLRKLSGGIHQVITGVCVRSDTREICFSDETEVEFDQMTDEEISWYVAHEDILDKAGAYGIQDWIGKTVIKGIRGSFYNVVGLPVHKLYAHLKSW